MVASYNSYQEVNSTNTYLKNLAAETQLEEGTVILADNQTEGKGRGAINGYRGKKD
jgi:biotin-(acetyl-CoA carboxylase) ligase